MFRSSSVLDQNWWRIRSLYLPSTKTAGEPIPTAVAHQLIHDWKIDVRSADSRKWTDRRSETVRREKKTRLSAPPLRNSLSAMSPLRCSLALSRRKISRETSGTRIAVKHFADDLKFIEQVVVTDGQGHSHRRFRGRLCSSLTACRTTKVVLRALRTYR